MGTIVDFADNYRTHQGLVPVPLIIAKRLNFLKGRQPRNPSQTNGYLIF